MRELHFISEPTPDAVAYEKRFGFFEAGELVPYQLDLDNRRLCVNCTAEFGELARKCLKANRQITARDYVDAFFLVDGIYSGFGITTHDYDEFVRRASGMDILF